MKNLTQLRALLANQLLYNTSITHRDGVGMSYADSKGEEFIIRSEVPPVFNKNFYEEFPLQLTSARKPVLAHVRKASTLKENKLDTHIHPFYDDENELTLAHNGTLAFLDDAREREKEKEFPDMIDSQIFFTLLVEKLSKDGELVPALKSTMELFYGKFAFLIQHKEDYYAVRGKTADLHIAEIFREDKKGELDYQGFLINTEITHLKENLVHTLIALRGGGYPYKYTVKELAPEFIFKLDSDGIFKYVDEIKQNSKKVTSSSRWSAQRELSLGVLDAPGLMSAMGVSIPPLAGTASELSNSREEIVYNTIMRLASKISLSLTELDELLILVFGTPLSEVTPRTIRLLASHVVPMLEEHIDMLEDGFKQRRELWGKLIKTLKVQNRTQVYSRLGEFPIEFPWYLTHEDTLAEALEKATKERKSK